VRVVPRQRHGPMQSPAQTADRFGAKNEDVIDLQQATAGKPGHARGRRKIYVQPDATHHEKSTAIKNAKRQIRT
jgi:hypothetical protein